MDKINVLVIDDKKIIRDFFDFTLGYGGHGITVANNAKDALRAVKDKNFDIVFLDIVMPEKDGVSLLQEIKKFKPQLPVVVMSGYSVEEKRIKAQELGAVMCLKKPFEMEDVRKAVKMATGKEI